jgi:hypothetical protein
VNGGGIAHGGLQFAEEIDGFSGFFGAQEGDAEEIGSLEIALKGDGFLQLGDGGIDVAIEKMNTPEGVVSSGVIGLGPEDGLKDLRSLFGVALAKPGDAIVQLEGGVGWRQFDGFIEDSSGLIESLLGDGEVAELAEAERDGQAIVPFRAREIAGGERGLGGLELAPQSLAGIIGGSGWRELESER